MEHPFINGLDDLSLEQLGSKISELNRKLSIAHRTGNGYLCDQIRMALDSYQSKYREKLNTVFQSGNTDNNFDDKIDIS